MKPVSRESLSDAELRENHIQQILDIDGPDDASETARRQSQFLGPQLLCPTALCPLQEALRLFEQFHMSQPGRKDIGRGLRRSIGPAPDRIQQCLDSLPGHR